MSKKWTIKRKLKNSLSFRMWIYGLMITVILSVAVFFIQTWQSEQVSENQEFLIQELEKVTKSIGESQLKAIFYTEELNHEIREIYLKINLKKEDRFKDLCPFGVGIEFNDYNDNPFKFKKVVKSNNISYNKGDKEIFLESYDISSINDDGSVLDSIKISSENEYVSQLLIPIYLSNNLKNLVKDFHNEFFRVYLPENLINKTNSIELVVNGWAILEKDISKVFWREEPMLDEGILKDDGVKLKRPWSSSFEKERHPSNLWLVNVYKEDIPVKYQNLSLKELRGPIPIFWLK